MARTKRLVVDEDGHEAAKLLAHDLDDGGSVAFASGAELPVIGGVFLVGMQRAEGRLEQGGAGGTDASFGYFDLPGPLAG